MRWERGKKGENTNRPSFHFHFFLPPRETSLRNNPLILLIAIILSSQLLYPSFLLRVVTRIGVTLSMALVAHQRLGNLHCYRFDVLFAQANMAPLLLLQEGAAVEHIGAEVLVVECLPIKAPVDHIRSLPSGMPGRCIFRSGFRECGEVPEEVGIPRKHHRHHGCNKIEAEVSDAIAIRPRLEEDWCADEIVDENSV